MTTAEYNNRVALMLAGEQLSDSQISKIGHIAEKMVRCYDCSFDYAVEAINGAMTCQLPKITLEQLTK